LTTPELLKVIDQLGQAKVFNIGIFGGEPLMHGDFFKILKRIQSYPVIVSLNTNASLIDRPLAKKLQESKIRSFCVSFDGSRPEVMDRMRGAGAFTGCLSGVKYLRGYTANIMLSVTLTRYNIPDIRNMVILARFLGVAGIRFNHVFCGGNAACFSNEIMISPQEELKAINEIYNLHREFPGFISGSYLQLKDKLDQLKDFKPQEDKVIAPACGAATNKCCIRPDGKVTPCEVIWDVEAGDLRKQTFLAIWRHSPILQELRRPREVTLKDKPDCKGCRYQYLCFIGHRCSPYYYPQGLNDKSLYCWKGIDLEEVYALGEKMEV